MHPLRSSTRGMYPKSLLDHLSTLPPASWQLVNHTIFQLTICELTIFQPTICQLYHLFTAHLSNLPSVYSQFVNPKICLQPICQPYHLFTAHLSTLPYVCSQFVNPTICQPTICQHYHQFTNDLSILPSVNQPFVNPTICLQPICQSYHLWSNLLLLHSCYRPILKGVQKKTNRLTFSCIKPIVFNISWWKLTWRLSIVY